MRIEAFHACLIWVKTLMMVILRRAESSSSTRVVEEPQTRYHVAQLWPKCLYFQCQASPINSLRLLAQSSLGWRLVHDECFSISTLRMNLSLSSKASDIDKYSRVVFPIMFLTFHLMYWMIYLRYLNCMMDTILCSLNLRNNLYYDVSIAGEVPEETVFLQASEE